MIKDLRDILVISDMDGTLLTNDKELLPCNIETIRLFTSMGGRFTVATGRIVPSVAGYPELFELLSPGIVGNGTVLYDFKNGCTIASELLPRAVAKRAVRDVLEAFPQVSITVFVPDSPPYVVNSGPISQQLFDDEHISYLVRPFEELPSNWNKVIFGTFPEQMPALQAFVGEKSYPGTYCVASAPIYFEMLPEGVSKGSAMKKLCKQLDMPRENVHVIGDYYNDLEIMELAGHSIAMRNAPADITMQAEETTGSNQDGGVGQYLYKLIREYGK